MVTASGSVRRVRAYAKVNLALEVLGRRPDGFHEIVSVTQLISLHDVLDAEVSPTLRVDTDPPVVAEHENLVWRAADALAQATGRPPAARLRIQKRIPLAAGLGGGSSDAAAALRLLDRLWGTRLGRRRLAALAASLGSDVNLFLAGGTSLIRGRGEIVESLPPAPPTWLALACPLASPSDKTRSLYRALRQDAWSDGAATLALAQQIRAGGSLDGCRLVNAFDEAASAAYPGFSELRARLADAAGLPLHLTGAGPTLFALAPSRPSALSAARRMQTARVHTFVARFVARRPAIRHHRPGAAAPP